MKMKRLTQALAATAFALGASLVHAADIVHTAVAAGQFEYACESGEGSWLGRHLEGRGPFTVFAPTDAAFAKLPAGTVASLLADKEKLAQILAYHVVDGKVLSTDITT